MFRYSWTKLQYRHFKSVLDGLLLHTTTKKIQLQIKIFCHLINLRIASQQTTVKITEMISKIRSSFQEIPIKSLINILKNSTKNYKYIITKKTAYIQAAQIGCPMRESRQSLIYPEWKAYGMRRRFINISKNRLFGSCSTLL